jgi:diaminopimelate epimerase
MRAARFEKWQALGNDYVIVEADELPWELTPARVRRLCHRHLGIGADGVLLLAPADRPGPVARLRIFNPDGSEAELSGNGARQAVMYLRRSGWTDADAFAIQTAAGEIRPTITGPATCRMELGRAAVRTFEGPDGGRDGTGVLNAGGRDWRFRALAIGNPQCAIAVGLEELEGLDLAALGPQIEHHPLFPDRTNVSWFAELSPGAVRVRIFERGVGETLSSGTGAAGAAVAYVLDGGPSPVTARLDGGELEVEVGDSLEVGLTGWALPVYRAQLADELAEELGHEA